MPEQSIYIPTAPVLRALNVAIGRIQRQLFPTGFDVTPPPGERAGARSATAHVQAPDSLNALNAALGTPDRPRKGGRMVVWSGGSDSTIYGQPEVNYQFRAWHDWTHWRYQLPFTPNSEREVCEIQKADVAKHIDNGPDLAMARKLLHGEIVGQLEYQAEHGTFPHDQRTFVMLYCIDRDSALAMPNL